jgi:hypothetical protein
MKEGPDIDTLCGEGPDAVRARHDKASKFEPKSNGRGRSKEAVGTNQPPNGKTSHEVSLLWERSSDVAAR